MFIIAILNCIVLFSTGTPFRKSYPFTNTRKCLEQDFSYVYACDDMQMYAEMICDPRMLCYIYIYIYIYIHIYNLTAK